ncbi:MAG: hypothetical protein LBV41_02505 [Cytophagaceae bacterium]|nr:hypothetical protein [Cytophagaceae bacterium]
MRSAAYGKQTTAQLPLQAGRYERHFLQVTLRFDTLSEQLAGAVMKI